MRLALLALLFLVPLTTHAQSLDDLAAQAADRAEAFTLGTTAGGRALDAIAIGSGERDAKPALLVLGGVEHDDRASAEAYAALVTIMSGKARGTTGLFGILVSELIGHERQPITYENEGKTRRLVVGKKIKGEVVPVAGKDPDKDLVITNSQYWMGADITVATANQGRLRAFGRVWDFEGRSAEICQIAWHGPS